MKKKISEGIWQTAQADIEDLKIMKEAAGAHVLKQAEEDRIDRAEAELEVSREAREEMYPSYPSRQSIVGSISEKTSRDIHERLGIDVPEQKPKGIIRSLIDYWKVAKLHSVPSERDSHLFTIGFYGQTPVTNDDAYLRFGNKTGGEIYDNEGTPRLALQAARFDKDDRSLLHILSKSVEKGDRAAAREAASALGEGYTWDLDDEFEIYENSGHFRELSFDEFEAATESESVSKSLEQKLAQAEKAYMDSDDVELIKSVNDYLDIMESAEHDKDSYSSDGVMNLLHLNEVKNAFVGGKPAELLKAINHYLDFAESADMGDTPHDAGEAIRLLYGKINSIADNSIDKEIEQLQKPKIDAAMTLFNYNARQMSAKELHENFGVSTVGEILADEVRAQLAREMPVEVSKDIYSVKNNAVFNRIAEHESTRDEFKRLRDRTAVCKNIDGEAGIEYSITERGARIHAAAKESGPVYQALQKLMGAVKEDKKKRNFDGSKAVRLRHGLDRLLTRGEKYDVELGENHFTDFEVPNVIIDLGTGYLRVFAEQSGEWLAKDSTFNNTSKLNTQVIGAAGRTAEEVRFLNYDKKQAVMKGFAQHIDQTGGKLRKFAQEKDDMIQEWYDVALKLAEKGDIAYKEELQDIADEFKDYELVMKKQGYAPERVQQMRDKADEAYRVGSVKAKTHADPNKVDVVYRVVPNEVALKFADKKQICESAKR